MKTRYKTTDQNGLYFITSTIVEWLPLFTEQKYFNIIIDSLEFCRDSKNLMIYAFVLLDNHFHLIVSSPDLPSIIASIKKYTAKEILSQLKKDNKGWLLNQLSFYKKKHKISSKYQVWQEGYHPELIINTHMMFQKIDYIHYNPVKRGLVDMPEHWRFSSARNYADDDHSVIRMNELPV